MEEQILLKLPYELSSTINKLIHSNDNLDSIQFNITFLGTGLKHRNIQLSCSNKLYTGQLTDLPTLIESYKSHNQYIYYKSADIHQIAVIQSTDQPAGNNSNQITNKLKPTADLSAHDILPDTVNYNHGITPVTESIRSSRYELNIQPSKNLVHEIEERINDIRNGTIRETYELMEEYIDITDSDNDSDTDNQPIVQLHSNINNNNMNKSVSTPPVTDDIHNNTTDDDGDSHAVDYTPAPASDAHSIINTPILHTPVLDSAYQQPNNNNNNEFMINTNASDDIVDDRMLFTDNNDTDEYMRDDVNDNHIVLQQQHHSDINTIMLQIDTLQQQLMTAANSILRTRIQLDLTQKQQLLEQKKSEYGL